MRCICELALPLNSGDKHLHVQICYHYIKSLAYIHFRSPYFCRSTILVIPFLKPKIFSQFLKFLKFSPPLNCRLIFADVLLNNELTITG